MVFNNNLLLGAAGQGGGYDINQSIRFNDDDSAYLTRTPISAGDKRTWTFSVWTKRGNLGADRRIFTAASNGTEFFFDANDKLNFYHYSGGFVWQYISNALFRDPAAWYHFVLRVDTTDATAENRIRVYANGEQITDWGTSTAPSQNAEGFVNGTSAHYIGRYSGSDNNHWDGYLAEIHHVDGSSLAPTSFGEVNADTGEWVPIDYTGSYGTNGFYIDGADSSFLGKDEKATSAAVTNKASTSSEWGGETGAYTFATNEIDRSSTVNAIISTDLLSGDFSFDFTMTTSGGALRVGVIDDQDSNTFNGTGDDGGMDSMTNSWYLDKGNNQFRYGGVSQGSASGVVNGAAVTIERTGSTIKITDDGSDAHTFSQTFSGPVRVVISGGGAAFNLDDVQYTADGASGNDNSYFSSGLTAADQVTDSPTDNFPTLNSNFDYYTSGNNSYFRPNFAVSLLSEGNLKIDFNSPNTPLVYSTATFPSSGKFYFEVTADIATGGGMGIGGSNTIEDGIGSSAVTGMSNCIIYYFNGTLYNQSSTQSSYGNASSIANGEFVGVAVDIDNDAIWFCDNGTWVDGDGTDSSETVLAEIEAGTTTSAAATNFLADQNSWHPMVAAVGDYPTYTTNFGQSSFTGAAPAGFTNLSTANLDDPTIALPEKYFNTVLYEGNGGGQRVGQFQPITETYSVPNSVIFNDNDSAYLNRTPASDGNRQIMTFSWWMKRGNLNITDCRLFTAFDSNDDQINFKDTSDYNRLDVFFDGTGGGRLITSRAFDDSSTWNHCVVAIDTTQATSGDRVKIYINGVRVTEFDTETQPSLNKNLNGFNNNGIHAIGARGWSGAAGFYDGYLAEIYFIDGQQLDASSFGQLDASTNRWIPKDASGLTFGTNGYYLDMETAPGTGSGAGTDSSGNGNNWTESGFAASDQVDDSPTKNFCTLNPNDSYGSGLTLSNGNLRAVPSAAAYCNNHGTIYVGSGKWVYEVKHTTVYGEAVGWSPLGETINGSSQRGWFMFNDGRAYINTTNQGTLGTSLSSGDYRYIFYDADKEAMWFAHCDVSSGTPTTLVYENGATKAEIESGDTSNAVFTGIDPVDLAPGIWMDTSGVIETNFGQSSFYTTSTLPTGFNTLNNDNLPLSNGDLSAFVWIKNRDATDNHMLFDAVRGVTKDIHSNSTAAEVTNANTLTRFLKNGFEVSNDAEVNTSGESYVAWQWLNDSLSTSSNADGDITSTVLANTTSGVSIVKYAGSLSTTGSATVGHGLGTAPLVVISKSLDSTAGDSGGWSVQHTSLAASNILRLNTTAAASDKSANGTLLSPTSTVFYTNYTEGLNVTGNDYIAYCFAEVEGFSKFSSYTGNGSTDGPFVYTGFKPRFVMIKRYDGTESWPILDTARGSGNFGSDAGSGTAGNDLNAVLVASTTAAEEDNGTGSRRASYVSNGFKVRTTNTAMNANGGDYLYMAFAESPFKTATAR